MRLWILGMKAWVWGLPLLAALGLAGTSYWFFPSDLLLDDAAFTLRYMDNLAAGQGYRFNPGDPEPVYGASSFLHVLLSTGLTFVLPPTWHSQSYLPIRLPGMAGYATLLLLAFSLGYRGGGWIAGWLAFAWIALVPAYFLYAATGLEVLLASGLLALAFYCFYENKGHRGIFICCALLVWTKHDLIPAALILACAAAWLHVRERRDAIPALLRDSMLLFVLPTLSFFLFCIFYFGSLIPNSLYAKMVFHPQAPGEFPYFHYFLHSLYWLPLLPPLFAMAGVAILSLWRRKWPTVRFTILLSVAGLLLLPVLTLAKVEIHDWYFVNPILVWQLLGIAAVREGARWLPRFAYTKGVTIGLLALLALPGVYSFVSMGESGIHPRMLPLAHLRQFRTMYETLEREKRDIGHFLRGLAQPGQSVMVAHGWTAYDSGLHAYDLTGINSKEALALKTDRLAMLDTFQPDFIALHVFNFAILPSRYNLIHISKDLTRYTPSFWQVWSQKPEAHWLDLYKIREIMSLVDWETSRCLSTATIVQSGPQEIRIASSDPTEGTTSSVVFPAMPLRNSAVGLYVVAEPAGQEEILLRLRVQMDEHLFSTEKQIHATESPVMAAVAVPAHGTGTVTVEVNLPSTPNGKTLYLLDPFCVNGVDFSIHDIERCLY
jgi:hypothetical protein